MKYLKWFGVILLIASCVAAAWQTWLIADGRSDQIGAIGVTLTVVGIVLGLGAWLFPRQPAPRVQSPASVDRSIRIVRQDGGVNITGDNNLSAPPPGDS